MDCSSVDDGYSCLKRCYPSDPVSRVRAQMDTPFSVEYKIDKANRDTFMVQQDRNIGIVKMITPINGPKAVVVRLHLNIYSRSHVLLAHNIAIITVYVSPYTF
uniref:Fibulin-1 n=1 Tax=Loa loa TaxID=7209 RepID=A0A1I7V5A0_LOALO